MEAALNYGESFKSSVTFHKSDTPFFVSFLIMKGLDLNSGIV